MELAFWFVMLYYKLVSKLHSCLRAAFKCYLNRKFTITLFTWQIIRLNDYIKLITDRNLLISCLTCYVRIVHYQSGFWDGQPWQYFGLQLYFNVFNVSTASDCCSKEEWKHVQISHPTHFWPPHCEVVHQIFVITETIFSHPMQKEQQCNSVSRRVGLLDLIKQSYYLLLRLALTYYRSVFPNLFSFAAPLLSNQDIWRHP